MLIPIGGDLDICFGVLCVCVCMSFEVVKFLDSGCSGVVVFPPGLGFDPDHLPSNTTSHRKVSKTIKFPHNV